MHYRIKLGAYRVNEIVLAHSKLCLENPQLHQLKPKSSSVKLIKELMFESLLEDNVTANNVINEMKSNGVTVSRSTAQRAIHSAKDSVDKKEKDTHFQRMESFCDLVEKDGGKTDLTKLADDSFEAIFIAPGACIKAFQFCRPVVAFDATFIVSRYLGCLLLATCLDANQNILILAFGIVEKESIENCSWFVENFEKAYGSSEEMIFISDKEKGIIEALKKVYPGKTHCRCARHFAQNLKKRSPSQQVEMLFYQCVRAHDKTHFDEYMEKIKELSPIAFEYLNEEPHENWSTYAIQNNRYGIHTSNMAETMNKVMLSVRTSEADLENFETFVNKWHENFGYNSYKQKIIDKMPLENMLQFLNNLLPRFPTVEAYIQTILEEDEIQEEEENVV